MELLILLLPNIAHLIHLTSNVLFVYVGLRMLLDFAALRGFQNILGANVVVMANRDTWTFVFVVMAFFLDIITTATQVKSAWDLGCVGVKTVVLLAVTALELEPKLLPQWWDLYP
ncbi:hypothetical protein BDV95DRAFT_614907 [Massariosphaeria phaeospora]|uniref:Uncharacterized protein n=1 Tax=Massariosphaeria phaeospora TaxID=100035 RepID=A0A7C8MED4_9PLEO|nr:hypothetical protein BDV95DRAFT_614907 [Massariosphaeria phaeospora]